MILEDLTIRLHDSWLCEISRANPEAEINLVEFQPTDSRHWRGLLQVKNCTKEFLDWFEGHEQILNIKLIHWADLKKEDYHYIAFSCDGPLFLNQLVKEYNIFFQFPIHLEHGEMKVKVVSTEKNLVSFYEELKKHHSYEASMNSKTKIKTIHQAELTSRQIMTLKTAIERGYYEIPRKITLMELASEMKISQATTAEHLRKAESYVMKTFPA